MGLFLPPYRGNDATLERILAISRNLFMPITRVGLNGSISKPRAGDRAGTDLGCPPMNPQIQCPVCGAWHSKSGLGGQCPACVIAVTLRTGPPKAARSRPRRKSRHNSVPQNGKPPPGAPGKVQSNFVQSNSQDYESNS